MLNGINLLLGFFYPSRKSNSTKNSKRQLFSPAEIEDDLDFNSSLILTDRSQNNFYQLNIIKIFNFTNLLYLHYLDRFPEETTKPWWFFEIVKFISGWFSVKIFCHQNSKIKKLNLTQIKILNEKFIRENFFSTFRWYHFKRKDSPEKIVEKFIFEIDFPRKLKMSFFDFDKISLFLKRHTLIILSSISIKYSSGSKISFYLSAKI